MLLVYIIFDILRTLEDKETCNFSIYTLNTPFSTCDSNLESNFQS
jgi:hypothetical protein